MKVKYIFSILFYSLLFLFYPGNNFYYHLFAYNKNLFQEKKIISKKPLLPIPYLKNPYYLPNVTAQGIYVVDLPSFTPILKKNEHSRFYPASTTKIITALVSYDLYQPDQLITIKNPLLDGQVMNLVDDEKITVENLLYGILVHSANDAAYALANNYGLEEFVFLMNKKAASLKMKNTQFKNPAGLDDINQYTTPFDLALAAKELLKNKYLAKIASTKEITVSDVDFKYFHQLKNVNKLLGEIAGIGGLKTGYTEDAGENLISFYKKNNHQFLIVILKSNDRFADTKNIIDWININVDYFNFQ
ncbi:MAG: D-alanyl-D-alanine carboxypeptidase family protein [Microgenomates group bacterium]